MATITGMTSAAMTAILNGTIASAAVVGNDLILTKHDGSTVNAGNVRGAAGAVGPAGLSLVNIAAQQVQDVGNTGQIRAGRKLKVVDFTTLCGLPTTPAGLFNLDGLTNLGSGGALINKGTLTFGPGITNIAGEALVCTGANAQAMYTADIGAADPYRIKAGTLGCWFRTGKKGMPQTLMAKANASLTDRSFALRVNGSNFLEMNVATLAGAWQATLTSALDVTDDRWHFVVATYDSTMLRIYIDGVLDSQMATNGPLYTSSSPFNIGNTGSDASNNGTTPFYGVIDEAFVTMDVLSGDQIRLLYAAAIPHGFAAIPKTVIVNVARRRRGPALASGDFLSQPARLYNLSDLLDLGSNNVPLTLNPGSGQIYYVPGPDGNKNTAMVFIGAHTGASGTDAGLPSALTTRTLGAWFKTSDSASRSVMGYGTVSTGEMYLFNDGPNGFGFQDGPNTIKTLGRRFDDGSWHHVAVVINNTASDGLKVKLYVDGILMNTNTSLASTALLGANRFRIGARTDGTIPFIGSIARAFVSASALSPQEIRAVYNKGAQDLGISPKNSGDHVEAVDNANVYAIFDTIDSPHQVSMAVAA